MNPEHTHTIVAEIGDKMVIRTDAPFGRGYNVYQQVKENRYRKINSHVGWFTTQDAAEAWAKEQQE